MAEQTLGEAIADGIESPALVQRLRRAADREMTHNGLVLVHRDDLVAAADALDPKVDWTVGEDGRTNTSDEYRRLSYVVEQLIRGDAATLLAGRADATAALIVANLAHRQQIRLTPDPDA